VNGSRARILQSSDMAASAWIARPVAIQYAHLGRVYDRRLDERRNNGASKP
jgi:hypothetical protein